MELILSQHDYSPHLEGPHGVHQHRPPMEPHPLAQQDGHQSGHRHEAQAADLNQQQDDRLTEEAEAAGGVEEGKAGDAGGGGGGKQGVLKGHRLPVPGGQGKGQQRAANENQQRETGGQGLYGVEPDTARHVRPPSSK